MYSACFDHLVLLAPGPAGSTGGGIRRIELPHDAGSPLARFAAGLLGRDPAILRRLAPGVKTVLSVVRDVARTHAEVTVLYEDLVTAGGLAELRSSHLQVRTIARCHNVLGEVFEGLGRGVARIPWAWERGRIRRFERQTVHRLDRVWTLSGRDAEEVLRRYGRAPDGVLPVAIDVDRYGGVPPGDPSTVVHVGSADLRKGHGLRWFLDAVWPDVRLAAPDARLVLAGRGTERLRRDAAGVSGLGFVEDDREVLRRGTVFVNPQQVGSGVKIKSLVAMAAARCLVTTPKGVEGIAVHPRVHCHVEQDAQAMAARIVEAVGAPARALAVGRAGRQFVSAAHAPEVVMAAGKRLLDPGLSGARTAPRG
ncbi:MAG TPA: glycosyltransferase family 4 protein [Longimicrobiales bacterium]|nr:glycosyltransferase family 4 protein [Longimicrobiales bacterium]